MGALSKINAEVKTTAKRGINEYNLSPLDCSRWYAINSTCEKSGNVWLAGSKVSGPYPLFVNATDDQLKQYTSGYYGRSERRVAWLLNNLLSRNVSPVNLVIPDDIELGESQSIALATSSSEPISVIVGGPGTGKTTIARILSSAHASVIGLSPTGKGAARLSESIGVPCYTIDRACFRAVTGEIRFDKYHLMIIDESGMLDVEKLDMLLRIIYQSGSNCRIVFIGDSGQLPSVGPGKVLAELSDCLPCSTLDLVYRYDDIDIGIACEDATKGLFHEQYNSKYRFIQGDLNDAMSAYHYLVKQHGVMESRAVTIHRSDSQYFNEKCYSKFNSFPIVCNNNNYDYDVFNGQTGFRDKDGYLIFGSKRISPRAINWSYAFSSTCHKAQGGQWSGVLVWINSARYLTREWLRTALSRATSHLIVVVKDAATAESCLASSKPSSKRVSLLSGFMRGTATWAH